MVQMSFKDNSYLELWQPLCSVDWNHLCIIGRRHHEEQCCKIILNLNQWLRRKCRFKVFLIWSSGSPFVQWSITIVQILVEGIKRNNSVKLFLNLAQWFRRFLILSGALAALLFSGAEPLMQF